MVPYTGATTEDFECILSNGITSAMHPLTSFGRPELVARNLAVKALENLSPRSALDLRIHPRPAAE